MTRSKYSYDLKKYDGVPVIMIIDQDVPGFMSVTNDMENVVEEISRTERINPVEHIIVYRDSVGNWNGFNFSTGQFIIVSASSWQEAVEKIKEQ